MSDEELSSQIEHKEVRQIEPTAVFLSGLSGTGKSTLVEYFNNNPIDGWGIFDFDKGRYPCPEDESEHLRWRQEQTNWWLEEAHKNALEKGLKTGILGLSLYPADTKDLPAAQVFDQDNIHFALIHTDSEERKRRIVERGTPRHLREKDWHEEFYRVMRQDSEREFDTTNKKTEESAEEISEWLKGL